MYAQDVSEIRPTTGSCQESVVERSTTYLIVINCSYEQNREFTYFIMSDNIIYFYKY